MFRSIILSVVILFQVAKSQVCENPEFQLLLDEDAKAFSRRNVQIFYSKRFRSVADTVKCQLESDVKSVQLREANRMNVDDICRSEDYQIAMNTSSPLNYFVTISESIEYPSYEDCSAINQFNMMKFSENKWAVHIRGLNTDIMLPLKVDEKTGLVTETALNFALNAMFFASAQSAADDTYKSLTDGKTVKKQLVQTTVIIYVSVLFAGIFTICALVALLVLRRKREKEKRSSEKSKLLKNQANDKSAESDATPVEFLDDGIDKH